MVAMRDADTSMPDRGLGQSLRHRIERSVHELTTRIRLDADTGAFPTTSEIGDDHVGIDVAVGERSVETAPALQHRLRTAGPGQRQACGEDTAETRVPRMQDLGVCPSVEEFEQAARRRRRDADGVGEAIGVGTVQESGGDGTGERTDDGGRMEAACVEAVRCGRAESTSDLQAGHQRGHRLRTGRADFLGDGQDGRCHDRRRMHERTGMRVVEVQSVHQNAVGEGRRRSRDGLGVTERMCLRRTAEPAGHGQSGAALVESTGADRIADPVEQMPQRRAPGDLGDVVDLEARGPGHESAGGHGVACAIEPKAPASTRPRTSSAL